MNTQTYFHFYFIQSLLGKPKLVDAITHLRGAFYNIALLLRACPCFIPVDRVPAFLSLLLDMILILLSFSAAPPVLLSIHFSIHLHILCLLIWKLIPLLTAHINSSSSWTKKFKSYLRNFNFPCGWSIWQKVAEYSHLVSGGCSTVHHEGDVVTGSPQWQKCTAETTQLLQS